MDYGGCEIRGTSNCESTLDVERMVVFVESSDGKGFASSPRAATIHQTILNEES